MRWREILPVLLAGVLLAGLFFPSCAVAAGTMPVVRSIDGPTGREIVSAGAGGTFRVTVAAAGGSPPYTYTWLRQPVSSGSFDDQDGIVYNPTEGDVLASGPSSSIGLSHEDLDTDGRGKGWISVIVTDSSGRRALWQDGRDIHDYFVWGIDLWQEDYGIKDEFERAVAAVHVYTLPPSFPYDAPAGSAPTRPGGTAPASLVPVQRCPEAGARCYGGEDCADGTCVDPCEGSSSPYCQCDCIVNPPEPGIPWVVIVGGLAVVAVAAGLIAALRGRPKSPDRPPEKKGEQPPDQYILQLSKDSLKVGPEKNDSFTATAWKVTEDGGFVPAPDARIQLAPPPKIPALVIEPAAGSGSLTASVSLSTYPGPIAGVITVTASAGGRTVSADVKVTIEGRANIEFD
jgi:hypothetical protein